MCRSPSARQSMLVVSENFLRRAVIQDAHFAPAPPDLGHVLKQRVFVSLTPEPPQSLLDGALGCRRDVLAGQLRQTPRQLLRFGVFDAKGHAEVPWCLNRYILAWPSATIDTG